MQLIKYKKISSRSLVPRSQRQNLSSRVFDVVCRAIDGDSLRDVTVQPQGERFGDRIIRTDEEKRRALIGSTIVSIGRSFGATGEVESDILRALVDFVDQNFQNLSIDEIRLAFNMASAGDLQADVSLYGKPINLDWLSRILRAYMSRRRHIAAIVVERQEHFDRIMNTDEAKVSQSRRRSYENMIDKIVEAYQSESPEDLFLYHFKFTEKIGAIVVTKAEKKKAFDEAKPILIRILRKEKEENKDPNKRRQAEKDIIKIISTSDQGGRQSRQAIIILFRRWFSQLREKGVSAEGLSKILNDNFADVADDLCRVQYIVTVSPAIGADRQTKPLTREQLSQFLENIGDRSIKIEII